MIDDGASIPGWCYNLPLWKIWVRHLGWWNSQLNGNIKHIQTTNQINEAILQNIMFFSCNGRDLTRDTSKIRYDPGQQKPHVHNIINLVIKIDMVCVNYHGGVTSVPWTWLNLGGWLQSWLVQHDQHASHEMWDMQKQSSSLIEQFMNLLYLIITYLSPAFIGWSSPKW